MDPLESYLAEHDVPCPNCGYNLRGLRGNTCPECGETIDLGTILSPLRWALRQRFFIGRAAAASFALGATLMSGRSPDVISGNASRGGVIGFVTGAALLVQSILWLSFARRLSERPLWQQSAIASAMWFAIVVAILIAFS